MFKTLQVELLQWNGEGNRFVVSICLFVNICLNIS